MTELMVIAACVALFLVVGSLHRAASIRRFASDLEFHLALERSDDDARVDVGADSEAALRRFERASDDTPQRPDRG